MKIKAMKGKVLVSELERGSRVVNGIILPDDNGKSEGVRPRWAKVYAIGDDITTIQVGQWVLVEHGRWTRSMKIKEYDGTDIMVWAIDWPKSGLLVSDTDPEISILSQYSTTTSF